MADDPPPPRRTRHRWPGDRHPGHTGRGPGTPAGRSLFSEPLGREKCAHGRSAHEPRSPGSLMEFAVVAVLLVGLMALLIRAVSRPGGRRTSRGPGPGATGAVYDMLNEDKRKAIEII